MAPPTVQQPTSSAAADDAAQQCSSTEAQACNLDSEVASTSNINFEIAKVTEEQNLQTAPPFSDGRVELVASSSSQVLYLSALCLDCR